MGRRLDRDGRKFQNLAIGLLCSMGHEVYQCKDCGYPVIYGYVCCNCDSDDPIAEGDEPVIIQIG